MKSHRHYYRGRLGPGGRMGSRGSMGSRAARRCASGEAAGTASASRSVPGIEVSGPGDFPPPTPPPALTNPRLSMASCAAHRKRERWKTPRGCRGNRCRHASPLSLGMVCPLEVSVSSGSIQVARGQTAVLPCTFTTNAALTNLNVIWMVTPLSNANQPEQVILYQGGQIFGGAPQFYGRVGFAVTMPTTSASIFINNTQLSDTGTYQCLVNNLPDRGSRNIGVIGLTVLVPPSAPLCRIQGSLEVGSDITLTCSSEEGIPRPTYLWEKLDNVPKLPPTATQDQVQGTVTLRNISTVSSGLYQCVASNAIGTSTCLLDLQVVAPHPWSISLIAGAVATGAVVLIVCIVLVAIALFYWKNKHKEEEEEEIPNEIREDDLPPKCSSTTKTFHADASSSENDTLTSSNTYNSRYWNDPKANHATDSFTRFSNSNDARQPPFSRSGSTSARPVYANGGHPSPAAPKTLVVTASTAPSPQEVARSNGSVSRKPRLPHTRSYAVSQATLERIGAVPVMVPAQSRAGSLV